MRGAEDRYRTLLDASSTLADQPTVKAVLHSLRGVLSSASRLHGAELYVFSNDGDGLSALSSIEMRTLPRSELVPDCYVLARWRRCLRNRGRFSSRTCRRRCSNVLTGSICTRSCRTKHLFVSGVYLTETIWTCVNAKVAG